MSIDQNILPDETRIRQLEKQVADLETEAEKNRFSHKLNRALFDISNAVMTTENLSDLYATIYDILNRLRTLPNFYIAIYNKAQGTLRIPYFIDEYDADVYYEMVFNVHASLTGEVILAQKPLFLTEEMLIERNKGKRLIGTQPKIWVGVPLIVRKNVIGIMAIQHYHDPRYFEQKDQDLLESVSHQVALAIERKQSLDEITLLQNYLFNIINSMPSILVGVNKEQQVTQWNLQAQMETGIRVEDAVGRKITEVFPRLSANLEQIDDSITSKQVKTRLKNSVIKNGTVRYEDIIIYPLITNGVDGAVIRMDDITDQVRLEEMMIQSEKMMSIGGLAAGMAHEINNPLAGMMQNAQLVYRRLSDHLPANDAAAEELGISMDKIRQFMEKRKILENLEMINKTGSRAARIITNMLNFARKSDAVFEANDMARLLMDTLDLAKSDYNLKKQYDFKNIRIKTDFDPDMPKVYCDKNKIQQVFLNVFKNGAQAMAEALTDDKEPRFWLRLKRLPEAVRIEIQDNGPGMDPPTQKRLFEPFFTTKDVGKGTGLGLSVSYFIIANDHNGQMRVESAPGEGTTFTIDLPIKRDKQ